MSRRAIVLGAFAVALATGGGYLVHQVQESAEWAGAIPALPGLEGKHPEFRQRLTRAQDEALVDRGNVRAVGELARLYLANGYMTEAGVVLALRAGQAPDEARWHHWLAGLRASFGQLDAAVPEFKHAVTLAPEYLPARLRLAEALAKLNRTKEAGAAYASVLEADPGQVHALLGLARIAIDEEDWPEAARRCEKAIAADEQFSGAWSLLATVALRLGESERAEAARRRAAVLGRFRDMADPWTEELITDCYDSYRLQVAASTLASTGSGRSALAPLIRAVQLWPDDGKAHRQLGRVYLKIREFDAARRSFERAKVLLPTEPALVVDLLDVHRNTHDIRAAELLAEEGLRRFPDSAGLNFEYGMLLVTARRSAEAIPYLEKARRLEPENVEAAIKLVPIYFREGRFEAGGQVLDETLAREPNNVPLLLMSVRYRIEKGEEDKARQHWRRAREFGAEKGALDELGSALVRRFGGMLE